MKKLIIALALLLTSVTVANAGLRCEIVQVLPGIFLPQCDSSYRYVSRDYYRGDNIRWGYKRGSRHNRYDRHYKRHNSRNDRYYYGKKRHPRVERDIYDRPHNRDNHRW